MAELSSLGPDSSRRISHTRDRGTGSHHEDETEPTQNINEPGIDYPEGMKLWLIMLSVTAVLVLSSVDMNIVATAVPSITDHFHTVAHIGWYSSAFRLCVCAFQFIFGKAYRLFSVKRVFLLANAISIAGSILSGAAATSTMLVVGRAVSGLGAAGLFAGCFVIVVQSTPLRQRPMFLGIMGAAEGLATIAAPLLGGALQTLSWRWCFYVNAPIGSITFLVCMMCLPDTQKPIEIVRLTLREKVVQLDLVSNVLLLPALTSLFLAFSWAGTKYSWTSGEVIGPLVTFAILSIAFILNQLRQGETGALPPRLMKHRSVVAGFIFMFCINSTGVVLEYYLPTYYQLVRGYTPVKSGYMILPIIIAATIGSLIHGAGTSVFGYYTPFMILASVIMPIAIGLITTFEIDTSMDRLVSYTALSGLAYGIGFIGPQTAVQTVLPAEDVPLGLSIMLFAQSFGPAVTVPIAQVLFTNQLSTNLEGLAPGLSHRNISNSGLSEMVASVPGSDTIAVLIAVNKSLNQTFYFITGLASVAIVGTFLGGSIAETPEIETLPACGVNCLRDIFLRPQFVHQTQQQLCDNTEFIISIGTCLRENCNGTEKQAFLDAASKKCVIPAQDATVALRASSLVIFGSALGAYILRLISKCIYKSEWGADDTFMSLAAFLIIPLIVLLQLMVSEGIGRDLRTLKDEQIVFCFQMFFFQQVTYFIVLGLVKASVLVFYLRIFPDHKFRIAVWVTQFVNLSSAGLYVILILLQKTPISLNWTGLYKPNHHGDVLNDKLLYLTHGIISMALDIWMVILPFTQVYHLGIKLRKKIGVLAMFSCGILLVGTSIIRFYYLVKYQVARDAEEAVKAVMWANIELCMGVVVGCMPNIRQLTRRAHRFIISRSGHSNMDPEQNSGIFRQRSLAYISNETTVVVGEEKGTGATASSFST
uniref:Major facilitator superfamily (MFS) profile domain-containing protein n=1 Tax=Gibberella zeae TaxID=5518 RepID=A0A4E9EGR7_GIBZA